MLNWIINNKKKLVRALTLTTMLLVISIIGWIFKLNYTITDSLKNKKFLPPTQYYSAPEFITPRMNLTSTEIESKLIGRQYQIRSSHEQLKPGEYSKSQRASCAKELPSALPDEVKSCLLFHIKDNDDPEFTSVGLQMITFDSADKPYSFFKGNPLTSTEFAALEPRLVAEYLDKEPIQQNYAPLGEIPTTCLNAVLSIEDVHFLEHSGVSYTGIARALFHNLVGSGYAQGGSTITQQMVKNYFLTSERTLKRKITEFIMSLILEAHSSKDEIFETYLNIIYLGQSGPYQIRGFPAAAQYFFGKKIESLKLNECALLAAVLNSPGLYDPFHKPENARRRRNLVLDKMLEYQFIRSDEAEAAKISPLPSRAITNVSETAPYYIDVVQKELSALSVPIRGMKVYTGLSLEAQSIAQKAVREHLDKLESDFQSLKTIKESGKSLEAALLSANNDTGLIQAIVGGRSYKLTQFNRAVDAHRQVGSIMKPFVYLAALESSKNAYTPMTILKDAPFTYEYQKQSWKPENYDQEYFGDVPMYFALKKSLNCATASLGIAVGLDKIIDVAKDAGIESKLEKVPSLTLGAFELSAMEVLQSYSTLANLGQKRKVHTVRSVVNEYNGVVYQSTDPVQNSLPAEPTAQVVSMMKQTVLGGTARSIINQGFTAPAAGKTGTTSDYRDSWFGGFTPYLTTVAWVGYDDNTPDGLTGASGALPIWISYMKSRATLYPATDFQWPSSLTKVKVNNPNDDPKEAELLFVPGTEPKN